MKNIAFISISRVVAMLSIVLCHIIKYYTFIPGSEFLGQFFNVGVQMFIIISGYLYGIKFLNGGGKFEKPGVFLWKRLIKVSLPVQLFALMLLAYYGLDEIWHTLIVLLNLQGIGFIINTELFGTGSKMGHTWFITVILICYLLTPILHKWNQQGRITPKRLTLMWIIALILPYLGIYLGNIALYVTSFYVSANRELKRYNITVLLLICFLAIAIRVIGRILFDETILYKNIICLLTHIILAISIMLIIRELTYKFSSVLSVVEKKLYQFLEKHSFYIYITHYCLIPSIYNQFGLLIATCYFSISTLVLSVALRLVHKITERGIKGLAVNKSV